MPSRHVVAYMLWLCADVPDQSEGQAYRGTRLPRKGRCTGLRRQVRRRRATSMVAAGDGATGVCTSHVPTFSFSCSYSFLCSFSCSYSFSCSQQAAGPALSEAATGGGRLGGAPCVPDVSADLRPRGWWPIIASGCHASRRWQSEVLPSVAEGNKPGNPTLLDTLPANTLAPRACNYGGDPPKVDCCVQAHTCKWMM
jgi:hypothetical protein